jgi:glutamyl endopeptidase
MVSFAIKDIGAAGRVRECPPHGFPSSPGLRALFETGERRPRLRAASPDGTLGGFLTIIGDDDRERRLDTHEAPLRMIVSLELVDATGRRAFGTGFMIGRRTVGTCAHNLFKTGLQPFVTTQLFARPGRESGRPPAGGPDADPAPFGVHEVTPEAWLMHPQWQASQAAAHDVAFLQLAQPVGERTGWFGIGALSDAALADRMVNVAGYPFYVGNRNRMPPEPNRIPPGQESTQLWWHRDRVLKVDADQIFYDVDTFPGNSGSPVILMPLADDAFSGPTVVGVHTRGIARGAADPDERVHNTATRITPDILAMMADWVNARDA